MLFILLWKRNLLDWHLTQKIKCYSWVKPTIKYPGSISLIQFFIYFRDELPENKFYFHVKADFSRESLWKVRSKKQIQQQIIKYSRLYKDLALVRMVIGWGVQNIYPTDRLYTFSFPVKRRVVAKLVGFNLFLTEFILGPGYTLP